MKKFYEVIILSLCGRGRMLEWGIPSGRDPKYIILEGLEFDGDQIVSSLQVGFGGGNTRGARLTISHL